MDTQKSLFYERLREYYLSNKDAKKPWNYEEMTEVSQDILLAKQTSTKKTRRQYHLLSLYDTIEVGHKHVIIKKRVEGSDSIIYVTPYEDLFAILYSVHIAVGHGSRDKMISELKSKFKIPRPAIEIFLQSCETCHKKRVNKQASLGTNATVSKGVFGRGQVDLVDFQSCPDGEYKWLLSYQDYSTKFTSLRPLRSEQSSEVASALLKIFLEFGAPAILQSDNGREFVSSVLSELVKLWPGLKIVLGGPKNSQSPYTSTEKGNQEVERLMRAWMLETSSTNWSTGCYFVQFQKNCSHQGVIRCTPYNALFGTSPKVGLSSTHLTREVIETLQTEEDIDELLSKMGSGCQTNTDTNSVGFFGNASYEQDDFLPEDKQGKTSFAYEIRGDVHGRKEATETYNPLEESGVLTGVVKVEPADSVLSFGNAQENVNDSKEHVQPAIFLGRTNQNNASSESCSLLTSTGNHRHECHSGQKRPAERTLTNVAKKLPPFRIGDCDVSWKN